MKNLNRGWVKAVKWTLGLLALPMLMAACNNEDEMAGEDKSLQVSVSTGSVEVESRGIVNGSQLPAGSSIGVTLVNMDGTAYDGVGFNNLPYTAAGTGSSQTWSGSDISLSTTFGKAIAYHPYISGASGLQVPIETASQADYMYSGWVEYLYNGAYKAGFNMKHAMTDVQLVVKSGTYTGPDELKSITVESPFFATSAVMSIEDGTLSSVSGTGADLTASFDDAEISTGGFVHDFLTIPDTGVSSGELKITVMVGTRKFVSVVAVDQAFKQGMSYQYNLSLHNTGMTLEGAGVVDWSYPETDTVGNMTEMTE